jgi:3',5'-cyclic-AMP phosphodiesterase
MQSFRLIQFSDTHLGTDPGERLRGIASLPALQAAVLDARRRCPRHDGVLLSGDLVQDDPGGYRWIRATFEASNVPVMAVAGNHDLPGPMRSVLSRPPFQVGGEVAFGTSWLVVLLDTWAEHSAAGRLGTAQLAHLESVLAAHPDRHVLICLHHHPLVMRSHWLDKVGLEDAQQFLALVHRHRNVRGVSWGHVHQALDCLISGVRFMATPATCTQFRPESDDFAIDDRPPGYRILELLPDGSIATEVVWLDSYVERSVA